MLGRTREESHEIVVGTGVVLTALALGLFLHLRPAGSASGYDLQVHLAKTDGLGKGSEVRVSGVKVGTVSSIKLDSKTFLAVAQLDLDSSVKLPSDSTAKITSDSLLGGSHVAIEPGGAPDNLKAGDDIQNTQGAVDLFSLIGQFLRPQGQGAAAAAPAGSGAAPDASGK